MKSKSQIKWSIKEISEIIRERQLNKFDANIGVSGNRGNGKSTFLFKIFNSFKKKGFRPRKHQVYSQQDVIELLSGQMFSYCWDDEAINSGYKRDFQKSSQTDLIKIVTNYRDNFNVYGSALPFFYSLDKALRELIFMHVHIISRGVGVILLPLEGQIHTQDPWDSVTNKKIEAKENSRLEKNPDAKFRYHKLTTFAGYVYFGPMSLRQQKLYDAIKQKKRSKNFEEMQDKLKPKTYIEKIYQNVIDSKATNEGIMQTSMMEGLKYTTVMSQLNKMLKDRGIRDKSVGDFLVKTKEEAKRDKINAQVSNLIPEI